MTEFFPGKPACEAHTALKTAINTMEKARQNAVLWFGEILERKLYRELGYASIHQYAQLELGFSPARTSDFLSICRKLKNLPKLEDNLKTGKLGYTQARVLVKVADQQNEDQRLDFAQKNSRRELELEVKRAKKKAAHLVTGQQSLLPSSCEGPRAVVPVMVRLEMSPTQFARYEAIWEKIRKGGEKLSGEKLSGDKVEAMLEMMDYFADACGGGPFPRGKNLGEETGTKKIESEPTGFAGDFFPQGKNGEKEGKRRNADENTGEKPIGPRSSSRPPVQIHIHQCPDCGNATVQTSKGELKLSPGEIEKAQCDCMISQPGTRNTSSIPPKIRREVMARDRHKCQRPGCGNTRFLEVHHIIPRSRGGTNETTNLTCVCSSCHKFLHENEFNQGQILEQFAKGRG